MRKFSSYGPIDTDLHYYAPRTELIKKVTTQLTGNNLDKGEHYITIWAPRQTGKTWIMQQVVRNIYNRGDFDVAIMTIESAKTATTDEALLSEFISKLTTHFRRDFLSASDWRSFPKVMLKKMFKFDFKPSLTWESFTEIFSKKFFDKPVILIIDEFDALDEKYINKFVSKFRDMYISRQNENQLESHKKSCLLHGLALIGVRSVLGIENVKGSPFNVQRSIHIPDLTYDEVNHIYKCYEEESKQKIDQAVIDQIYYEFQGQPGLTCWFGELLTDVYNNNTDQPITMSHFESVLADSCETLPNNNILNIISKAKQPPHQEIILKLFNTDKKYVFKLDNKDINYLYMNGIIGIQKEGNVNYIRFASSYVQKRLFNYFSDDFFSETGDLIEPFTKLDHVLTENSLHIKNLLRLYEKYLKKNKGWLLKNAPRRKDLKIFEAVYHFNLFMYLHNFLIRKKGQVWPEFPTGNGKIDLIIKYANQIYGIELKTYSDEFSYKEAIRQAADYAMQLKLSTISLVFFVESIDDDNRTKLEKVHPDKTISVETIFIESGNT
ncbi:MAG: AAA-like domain-containing protein [Candidatus Magnetomorum sp.]|nr:AAA-like domain-containing protein [Candidatus Magnetomorum sp.]